MATYDRALKGVLRDNGWEIERKGKGSHRIWFKETRLGNRIVSVPNKIKSRHTANAILKDADIKSKL